MRGRTNQRKIARATPADATEVPTFASTAWLKLSPAERLRRSWRMRRLLPDPERVHNEKLWPRI